MGAKLASRPALAGLLNRKIPKIAGPTALTPTHTVWAVPSSDDFMEMPSKPMLLPIASKVPAAGHSRVKPSVYFRPMAQANSNSPAMTRMIQLIVSLFDVQMPHDYLLVAYSI